jgi:hypothetical protein
MAILRTPFRFRTKRNLWPYVGLAVVTRSSADREFKDGKAAAKQEGSAHARIESESQPDHEGRLQRSGQCSHKQARPASRPLRSLNRTRRERRAREVTLARKIVAVTLRLWKKGELWDPKKLTIQAT